MESRHLVWPVLLTLLSADAAAVTIESQSESVPAPGVRIVDGRTSSPGTDFYAAFIDLCADGVGVDSNAYEGFATTSSWASGAGATVAVNGDFFTTSGGNHVYGDAVAGGSRWSRARTGLDFAGEWYHRDYGWIAFGDGWVVHNNSKQVKTAGASTSGWMPGEVTDVLPDGVRALVSGFPQLVTDGDPVTCSSPTASSCFVDRTDMRSRHPRTAMGITKDQGTFILLVVDGRSSRSSGMYGAELSDLIHQLGAHQAFNLDGGGSAQMWVTGQGTVNRPSDGSPRRVLNHWGVFTDASRVSSCGGAPTAVIEHPQAYLDESEVDLNADGKADLCARTPTGIQCHLATEDGFGEVIVGPELSNAAGWEDPSNASTVRWGDLNADGRADLCVRANDGIRCWLFQGDGFGEAIVGPALADDQGWDAPMRFSSIRLADFNGDDRADLCARDAEGLRCWPFDGAAFGEPTPYLGLTDAAGWDDVSNWATIRRADVNGDGRDEFCGRGNAGIRCWPSDGATFGAAIMGPEWSNARGWTNETYWSSIRTADLDGDGLDDICARHSAGVDCHLSTGNGFSEAISLGKPNDAEGWDDPTNRETMQLADVNGDGRLDLRIRGNAGVWCWPFDGESFAEPVTSLFSDASGWANPKFYRTIQLADIDGDGDADLVGRAERGIVFLRATSEGFSEQTEFGPDWSDSAGFAEPSTYSSIRLLGARRPISSEPIGDNNQSAGDGGNNNSDGNNSEDNNDGAGGPDTDPDLNVSGEGCATVNGGPSWFLCLVGLLLFAVASRRPRRRSSRSPTRPPRLPTSLSK